MQGIYGYKDLKTGYIVYIGRDSYIDKNNRKLYHMRAKGQKRQQIDKVLQKNPDRYEYFVIKKGEYSEEDLNTLEKHYIDFYGTYRNHKRKGLNYGFNFTIGGDGSVGYKHSEETKERLRKINTIPEARIIKVGKINENQRWGIIYNGDKLVKSFNKKLLESLLEVFFDENRKILIDQDIAKQKMSEIVKKDGYDAVGRKKSKQQNNSGYFRVGKTTRNTWRYRYHKGGREYDISAANLNLLEKKVKKNNLLWMIIDPENARKSREMDTSLERKNKTGFYRVSGGNKKKSGQNNTWRYRYYNDENKRRTISSTNLLKLKQKVIEKNLDWEITDYDKAKALCEKHQYDVSELEGVE